MWGSAGKAANRQRFQPQVGQGRGQPEKNSAKKRHQHSEQQHAQIERRLLHAGNAGGSETLEDAQQNPRQATSTGGSENAQQQAFGKPKAGQSSPSAPPRATPPHPLFPASRAAHPHASP